MSECRNVGVGSTPPTFELASATLPAREARAAEKVSLVSPTRPAQDCVLFGSFGVVGYVSSKIPTM